MSFGTILENVKNNHPPFSKREKDVIGLLMQGMSNKLIAAKLGISEHTVEFDLKNIYTKLGVSSRAEAILALGKTPGGAGPDDPGESAVDRGNNKGHNLDKQHFNKTILLILAVVSLLLLLPVLFTRTKAWENYERECEYPDEASVGQTIERSNASGSKVYGQFGTDEEPPWDAKPGDVVYEHIDIPEMMTLFLQIRYSKSSPPSVPILVYLDHESAPRASIYPKDLGNWDQFAWTEPAYLGKVKSGRHSIKLSTRGQQYGVADLDQFLLTNTSP